jgi:hypothetical protein
MMVSSLYLFLCESGYLVIRLKRKFMAAFCDRMDETNRSEWLDQ